MKYLKITIITPSFNQGKYIEQSILSVLNQNYPNLEYIIIDGGSTDETLNIISKYSPYLTYWISEKDKGQSDAINKGLQISTGDIINWLNSDDTLAPFSLFQINNLFQQHNIDILAGASYVINHQRKNIISYPEQNDSIYQIPVRMPFPQPSLFYSDKILNDQKYVHNHLHYAMDMELLTRVFFSRENSNLLIIPKVFSSYFIHPLSKTHLYPLMFFNEWGNVFYHFCVSMNFSYSLNLINEMALFQPSNISINFNFPDTVIYKYKKNEKKFLAYFLKYRLFYFIEQKQFQLAYEILNYFKTNLSDYFSKWNMWKYYLSILKRKILQ